MQPEVTPIRRGFKGRRDRVRGSITDERNMQEAMTSDAVAGFPFTHSWGGPPRPPRWSWRAETVSFV